MYEHDIPNEFISQTQYTLDMRYLLCMDHGWIRGWSMDCEFHPLRGQRVLGSRGIYQQFNTTHLKIYVSQSYKFKCMETKSCSQAHSPSGFSHVGNWNTVYSVAVNGCSRDSCLNLSWSIFLFLGSLVSLNGTMACRWWRASEVWWIPDPSSGSSECHIFLLVLIHQLLERALVVGSSKKGRNLGPDKKK